MFVHVYDSSIVWHTLLIDLSFSPCIVALLPDIIYIAYIHF